VTVQRVCHPTVYHDQGNPAQNGVTTCSLSFGPRRSYGGRCFVESVFRPSQWCRGDTVAMLTQPSPREHECQGRAGIEVARP